MAEVSESLYHGPTYNLDDVKDRVSKGLFSTTRRVSRFILEHVDLNVRDAVSEVFEAVDRSGFRKSVELDCIPGVRADVYHVCVFDEEYYLKFFISDEEIVVVLSCCIDGMNH